MVAWGGGKERGSLKRGSVRGWGLKEVFWGYKCSYENGLKMNQKKLFLHCHCQSKMEHHINAVSWAARLGAGRLIYMYLK